MGDGRARDRRLHSHMSFDDDNEDNRIGRDRVVDKKTKRNTRKLTRGSYG